MAKKLDDIKNIVNEYVQQEKLAVFIGAGVSAMSDYPSWFSLVLKMAKKIGYPIKLKNQEGKEALSSDEYLKIPQIFYDNYGEKEYLRFVRRELHTFKQPNDIHKLIMQLKPNHILTTNYDTLIEQMANRVGMAYSVINSDKKVSTAPTRNYILKVHGDFETDNFVLKESDYLNYETNFKLIDNLVKSIISTHLVIFIGYSLNDYNIKLILNWVKQVQKDTFIKPIFIHTGLENLSEMEITYYEGENLEVVDANKLLENPKLAKYPERYVAVLTALLDPAMSGNWNRNDTWIIDHFYRIIEPLKDMKYLRISDIASLFNGTQIFLNNQLRNEDFKYLIHAYKRKEKLSQKRYKQLNEIIACFLNSGVEVIQDEMGHTDKELISSIKRGLIISNNTFDLSYQEINARLSKYSDDIDDLYDKAYDLFWLGRLNESMEVYYQLLAECYSKQRWILYFFSLINLYYIRQTIISLNNNLRSMQGLLWLGRQVEIWSEDEIREMRLTHGLTDIPAAIRKYKFLQKLIAKNYYKDDFVQMYQQNYIIEKTISKKMFTSAGRSKDQESKIRIYDAINFIYGNKITFDKFIEHKNFTKVALKQRFKGLLNQNQLSEKIYGEKGVCSYIDFYELLVVIRSFNYDDLSVFYEKENGSSLKIKKDTIEKFERYVIDLINYFKERFVSIEENEIFIEYLSLKEEIKNALFIASYYCETDDVLFACSDYIVNELPDDELDIRKKMLNLGRFKNHMTDPTGILDILEFDIVRKIDICDSGQEGIFDFEKENMATEVDAINEWFPDYKSELIKKRINKLPEKLLNSIGPIMKKII